jgi:hypothetical protein
MNRTAKCRVSWALLTGVLLVVLLNGSLSASANTIPRRSALTKAPAPEHLIVGAAIKLPAVLYVDNPAGGYSLITPDQAQQVETTLWRLWETELVRNDTRALSEIIAPGPLLAGTIDNCAFPGGSCVFEKTPRSFSTLILGVPRQSTYPLDFLAELRTTQYVEMSNGSDRWEPWVELQVVTKKSATAPWQLSFDTGYDGVDSRPPPLMTFDQYSDFGSQNIEAYATAPRIAPPVPTSKYLPLLAALYQSYKDKGEAPRSTPFVKNGYARAIGSDLASDRQGEIYDGNRQYYSFSADPSAGTWQFADDGYPLICGSVVDTSTVTPISGLIYQNANEQNYGIPLPAGEYEQVTTLTTHQTCVVVVQGGIDNYGDSPVDYEVTGEASSSSLDAPPPSPAVAGLQIAYGTLASQLDEYSIGSVCRSFHNASCTKTFAFQTSGLLASFANQLLGQTYVAGAQRDAEVLNATVRSLSTRVSKVETHPKRMQSQASAIQASALKLNEEFGVLINALQLAGG